MKQEDNINLLIALGHMTGLTTIEIERISAGIVRQIDGQPELSPLNKIAALANGHDLKEVFLGAAMYAGLVNLHEMGVI